MVAPLGDGFVGKLGPILGIHRHLGPPPGKVIELFIPPKSNPRVRKTLIWDILSVLLFLPLLSPPNLICEFIEKQSLHLLGIVKNWIIWHCSQSIINSSKMLSARPSSSPCRPDSLLQQDDRINTHLNKRWTVNNVFYSHKSAICRNIRLILATMTGTMEGYRIKVANNAQHNIWKWC